MTIFADHWGKGKKKKPKFGDEISPAPFSLTSADELPESRLIPLQLLPSAWVLALLTLAHISLVHFNLQRHLIELELVPQANGGLLEHLTTGFIIALVHLGNPKLQARIGGIRLRTDLQSRLTLRTVVYRHRK